MSDLPKQPEYLPGFQHERRLLSDLKRSAGHTKGRHAMQVHLGRLAPGSRPDHVLDGAETTFTPLVTREGAKFYWLSNFDFIVLFNVSSMDTVRAALVKIRFLFASDPLIKEPVQPEQSDPFVTWHDLDKNFDALIDMVRRRVAAQRVTDPTPKRHHRQGVSGPVSARTGAPLTPDILERVEKALTGADLSSHVRRQAVCAVVGKGAPDPVFTEVYVSIGDLREALLPHVQLSSNPWLFQRLTQTLDRRVLAMLSRRDDRTLSQGFSINLNVSTILSEDFLRFDESLSPGNHGTVILELRTEDIFSNLTGYFFARDYVRQRGYRICIDGLTWRILPYVNIVGLGADMVKMSWQDDLPKILQSPEGKTARDLILRDLAGRAILNRCDDETAIEAGQKMGFTLFQGRVLDRVIKPFLH